MTVKKNSEENNSGFSHLLEEKAIKALEHCATLVEPDEAFRYNAVAAQMEKELEKQM